MVKKALSELVKRHKKHHTDEKRLADAVRACTVHRRAVMLHQEEIFRGCGQRKPVRPRKPTLPSLPEVNEHGDEDDDEQDDVENKRTVTWSREVKCIFVLVPKKIPLKVIK